MRFLSEMHSWCRGCPVWFHLRRLRGKARYTGSGDTLDTVTQGEVAYGITTAFVEGTTLQDLVAAGAATTAIWVSRHPDAAGHLDQVDVKHGRYQVDTEVRVQFHPLDDDDEAAVPIFNGRKLVEIFERSQR